MSKKRIPFDTVTIAGLVFRIVPYSQPDSVHYFGQCFLKNQEILYDPEAGLEQIKTTMLHEIMHACFYAVGVNDHSEKCYSVQQLLVRVDHTLWDTLARNPQLVEWLCKGEAT